MYKYSRCGLTNNKLKLILIIIYIFFYKQVMAIQKHILNSWETTCTKWDGRVHMSNLDENIFLCFCMNTAKYKRTKIVSCKAHKQGSRPGASDDEACITPIWSLRWKGHSSCNMF